MKIKYNTKSFNSLVIKNKTIKKVAMLIFLILFCRNSFAQSDNCATASSLTVGTTCVTTNYIITSTFTNDGPAPCNGSSSRDGWFSFTTNSTTNRITIQGTSNRNLGLSLYSGTCGSLTQIACSVPGTANASLNNINVLPNTTYLLRLMRTNTGTNNMNGTICIFSVENIVPTTGNNAYTICSGNLYDNGGSTNNYATSSNGYTIINPSVPGNLVRVSGTVTVEGGFDYLTIYDGIGTGGTILWGGDPDGTDTFCVNFTVPTITSTTGPLTVRFFSDGSTNCSGFNLQVSCLTPIACSGTPSGGTVTVNPTSGAAGSTYAVTATGYTTGSGLTYQWQYSDTGGSPWTNQGTTTSSYASLSGMIAPANGIVRTWRLVVTCTAAAASANSTLATFTSTYCLPTNTFSNSYFISGVTTTGGVANINNSATGFSAYTDYSTFFVSQFPGSNFSLSATHPSSTYGYNVWVDWNNDGDFADVGENVISTGYLATPANLGIITIPIGQTAGNYRMRIRNAYLSNPAPACGAFDYGEAEDYTIRVLSLSPCTTPTAQPTALNLSVSGTTINGTFTAASPAPTGYLIVRSTSATAPTLTNGTTYATGFTGLTPGTTNVIQGSAVNSNSVSFSDTGLSANTQYYYYVFSYNANCTGSPFYLTTSPLTNSATTCNIIPPTAPINSAITGSSFTVTWSPSVGALNYVLEVYTNAGYTIPIAGSPFSIASPTVTYNVTGLSGPITYYYRIKANNGSCDSSYLTGSVTTLLGNNECNGAIPLSISSTCSYLFSSNSGATASVGIPAPGCALYSGGDVWFSVVVPVSGQLTVDLQSGGITDSGMAFYSGTCGALTLLECDDDDSNNGAMSNISMTGLTPGQTIYIRVWEYGNDTNGTFGICATTPSCPSPSDLLANILSTTSVTINWNASAPPASGGYQYFINTTGVAPTATTAPTGSTAPGVIGVTLTGLTPGLKYYFWVRSFCGGSDSSAWFGPTNYSPCAVGNGTGTTTLDCPAVLSGGLGLNGDDPPTMSCQALVCVDLEASYLQINQPTNYSVSSIPYAPPYQFTCLQNPVSVNVDDIWSPMINLPFNFCFYGNNYNRCLIGSNGVITFDTTTYAPGGYNNWEFNANLPNASLFRNTIFGVYHDIDPSIGGQVGWELITLNTGCRALVAAWNDIPMFSSTCNSQLYTGMIVLYENTNVIEVYVKEKNTCGTWNSGNAIVGIQNGAGTAAVVAPNRNGQSADWTVTNEAWRFTPTGTTLTTLKWFEGNGTSGTQIGSSNSINVCPTVTTTYTAEVTYALCNGTNLRYTDNVVVNINGNKVWNGTQGTNWNVNNNWTPSGVPTSANCVVIPTTANNPVLSSTPNGVGYNLSVYNGAQLTVNSNQNITITDKVTVQPTGIFTLNNSASLIQINNVLNSGNIIYKRDSPNIRTLDYVYWSSPVAGFNVSNIVLPYSFGGIFKWNTTLANTNGGQGGWQSAAGNIMTPGKGYIARAPGTAPFNNTTFNVLSGTFTGVPNNGNISFPIERGNDQNLAPHFGTNGAQITNFSDNWNLIGNPYPSAIRASQFLFDNRTKIEGNVRLWTHGTLPSVIIPNPFYGSYLSNYTPGDYLTYNFTGTSCCPTAGSDLFIGAGQGFFVQMVDGPSVAAVDNITVNFNNNLRNAAFSNSTFYKNQNVTTSSIIDVESIERNRIWLDFITPNNQTDRILFGYIENATMGIDSFYDCMTQIGSTPSLYSLADETKFSIQGRSLPFDINDEVPIGFNAITPGNYTIGITAVDGLFNNQTIYLKDSLLDIIHNIKEAPYTFTTQTGEINNRFKIVYVDGALGTPTNSLDNTIKVMTNNEVAVSSSNLEMASISVYTLLGQKLDTYDSINSNFIILSNLRKNNTTLLLKIKLETGETITKKIIY
jgi:hypothetical protein